MAKVILYFGSFNPVHNGHTSVARYVVERGLCDELWFVVSPENPLKERDGLAPERDRLEMARIAVSEQIPGGRVMVSDAEFSMPRPSYTIDTLRTLAERYPEHSFALLVGTDILGQIARWKDYRTLLRDYCFYVYPRDGYQAGEYAGNVVMLDSAPRWDYSSTDIRRALSCGDDITGMVSPGVADYINEHKLWQMDETQARIEQLTERIAEAPTAELYLERGKLYNRSGKMDKALNDFLKVKELEPENEEAQGYITMIREIFAFRYLDYYNP